MRFRKSLVLLLVIALLASVAGCAGTPQQTPAAPQSPAQTAPAIDTANAQLFVDATWLKANLDKVIVLDVRKADEYGGGHIPGAINSPWQSLANMTGKSGDPGWGTILPAPQLAAKLGSIGIDGQKQIITCGNPPSWGEDGRVMWVLNMAGIKNVKILDGGIKAWQAIQGDMSKEAPQPTAVPFTIAALNQDLNVTTDYVQANLGKIKIVDSRAVKEFQGATDFGEARGGHLPGAINLVFSTMYNENGTIKSSEALKKLFTDAGLKTDDEIVVYCTKGIRSAHMALMMRNLGFSKARNWDASYYEWAGNAALPVEK